MATLYHRLDGVFMKEAKRLKKAIYNQEELSSRQISEKDYGLTDLDILNHLSVEKSNEKALIKAFFRGNKNLDVMIEIFNKSKFEKGLTKIRSLKALKLLEGKVKEKDKQELSEISKMLKLEKKIFF